MFSFNCRILLFYHTHTTWNYQHHNSMTSLHLCYSKYLCNCPAQHNKILSLIHVVFIYQNWVLLEETAGVICTMNWLNSIELTLYNQLHPTQILKISAVGKYVRKEKTLKYTWWQNHSFYNSFYECAFDIIEHYLVNTIKFVSFKCS